MDDSDLFDSITNVLQAWNLIKVHGRAHALGLFVNAKKCELILLLGHLDAFSIEPSIKRVIGCNMDILGSPIGSNEHCELWISSKLDSKMDDLISKIIDLDHCHSSFELLFCCAFFSKWCGTFKLFPQS